MSCNCHKRPYDEKRHEEEIFKYLDVVGLRVVAEEATEIPETAGSATQYLDKSERADRLGLGGDVATLYRRGAERDRDQAVRQLRAMIKAIDERTGRDDWADLVARANREFEAGEGPALIDESRDRFRLAVLEMDGVSADGAEEIVGVWEESLDRIRADGLDGGVQLLKESCERWIEALESPEMGRQPASPRTVGQLACIAAFSAVAVVALAVCCFWWGCCCGYGIIVWLAAAIALCLAVPLP